MFGSATRHYCSVDPWLWAPSPQWTRRPAENGQNRAARRTLHLAEPQRWYLITCSSHLSSPPPHPPSPQGPHQPAAYNSWQPKPVLRKAPSPGTMPHRDTSKRQMKDWYLAALYVVFSLCVREPRDAARGSAGHGEHVSSRVCPLIITRGVGVHWEEFVVVAAVRPIKLLFFSRSCGSVT